MIHTIKHGIDSPEESGIYLERDRDGRLMQITFIIRAPGLISFEFAVSAV